MLKIFLSGVLPLLALACLWFALMFLIGGLRMLRNRWRSLRNGLHAGGVVQRHHRQSGTSYIPVFTYTDSKGDEVDIMGAESFASEEEALQAKRPLVYAAERPDAPMACNAVSYICRPIFLLLVSGALFAATHYLLLIMPD
jgi:hypothetical protein